MCHRVCGSLISCFILMFCRSMCHVLLFTSSCCWFPAPFLCSPVSYYSLCLSWCFCVLALYFLQISASIFCYLKFAFCSLPCLPWVSCVQVLTTCTHALIPRHYFNRISSLLVKNDFWEHFTTLELLNYWNTHIFAVLQPACQSEKFLEKIELDFVFNVTAIAVLLFALKMFVCKCCCCCCCRPAWPKTNFHIVDKKWN